MGDIARANMLAATSDLTDVVFNVASGTETSLLELAQMLLKVMGSDLAVEHGPARAVNGVTRRLADTSAAREQLGFQAEVDLEEGLTRLVEWWRAERDGAAALPIADARAGGLMQVPFSRPYLRGDEGAAVAETIATGWVSQGPRVREFEAAFAARVGARDAVATTNCTTALQLALYVSGIGAGDEVIVPSMSFIATANSVWQNGADAGVRRRRPADLQPRPGRRPSARSRAARGRSCRSTSSAFRPTWTPSSRSASATGWRSSRTPRARSARPTAGGRSARSGRWPASRCIRARSSPPARAA